MAEKRAPRANRKSTKDDFVEALQDAKTKYSPEIYAAVEEFGFDLAKRIGKLNLTAEDLAK